MVYEINDVANCTRRSIKRKDVESSSSRYMCIIEQAFSLVLIIRLVQNRPPCPTSRTPPIGASSSPLESTTSSLDPSFAVDHTELMTSLSSSPPVRGYPRSLGSRPRPWCRDRVGDASDECFHIKWCPSSEYTEECERNRESSGKSGSEKESRTSERGMLL